MFIRKTVTSVGIPTWKRNPCDWSDDMLDMCVKRILRKTKSRRVIGVEYLTDGFDGSDHSEWVAFEVEVGKKIKMSAKDRQASLKEMLLDERVIASI